MEKIKKRSVLFLILFSTLLFTTYRLQAQETNVTVRFNNVSLEQAIAQLEAESGYHFFYNITLIDTERKVSLDKSNAKLSEVLDALLEGSGIKYQIDDDKQVVLYSATQDLEEVRRVTAQNGDHAAVLGGVTEAGTNPPVMLPPARQTPQETRRITAQSSDYASIRGVLYEGEEKEPLPYAHVQIMPLQQSMVTNYKGEFEFLRLEPGRIQMIIQMLGMETIDTTFTLGRGQQLEFKLQMKASSFRLETVTVTATQSKTGQSSASTVSRAAMDHLQINRLSGIMQLMPGGVTSNPQLTSPSYFTIRSSGGSDQVAMNSLGTAIIVDGAPISNNANWQVLDPTRSGGVTNPTGGSVATRGVDLRQFSTDNIESVEVIRGIPGVEHGDLTAGAVIINSKAGYEPFMIRLKANPLIYEANVSQGFKLGENRGSLNASVNYANGTQRLEESYAFYQRVNARLLYSNVFGKLSSNTSFDYTLGKDTRKLNPDDFRGQLTSGSTENTVRFNTNGRYRFDDLWLKNIDYALSAEMTNQNAFRGALLENAQSTYTTSLTHGSVITNLPGIEVYDVDGNRITNIPTSESNALARVLPQEYRSYYEINGKPVNLFGKLTANISKQFTSYFNNRLLVGADFRSSGNVGSGVHYDPEWPPMRFASVNGSSLRPRKYSDIPFVNQLGLFVEENILLTVAKRDIVVSAGMRWDKVGHLSSLVPRVNASLELIPKVLSVRGGYGITTKAPISMYLYPDKAYFDLANYNNTTNINVPEASQYLIMSTYVFDVDNSDLEMATNKKREVGFDFRVGKISLQATGYQEEMHNGYQIAPDLSTYKMIPHTTYAAVTGSTNPYELRADKTENLFVYFSRPMNGVHATSKGVEFDLNIDRINAIRTSFSLTGAYSYSEYWDDVSNRYLLQRDGTQPTTSLERNLGIVEPNAFVYVDKSFVTILRAVHNIPRIGFVISLSAQVTWVGKTWVNFYQDELKLVQYMSYKDGKVHDFTEEMYQEAKAGLEQGATWNEFTPFFASRLLPAENLATPLWYKPYMLMNINVTKEISNYLRLSFYANNMFAQHPLRPNTRFPGRYQRLGIPMFVGLDMAITLR